MRTFNQISQSAVYREDDISVSLTVCGGSYGGGSEVLILQRRFSDVLLCDEDVAPTLEAGAGGGGNNLPMIMQNVTGTLNPGAHPGSYNGQDAYNDMLVVDDGCVDNGHRTGQCRSYEGGVSNLEQ